MKSRGRVWAWASALVVATLIGLGVGWGWEALVGSAQRPGLLSTLFAASESPQPSASASNQKSYGLRAWFDLRDGECLSTFPNSWQTQYIVVSCETLHQAQVLTVGQPDSSATFPGVDGLTTLTSQKCHELDLIDREAYPELDSLTIARTFPQNAQEWDAHPMYVCFAAAPKNTFFTKSVRLSTP